MNDHFLIIMFCLTLFACFFLTSVLLRKMLRRLEATGFLVSSMVSYPELVKLLVISGERCYVHRGL